MGYVCCCADCVVSRGRLGIEDCAEVLDGGRRCGARARIVLPPTEGCQ